VKSKRLDFTSSSYVEGEKCPLAKFGHNRDRKKGKKQINYGLVADTEGRPLLIDVYPGNTADSATLLPMVDRLQNVHGLSKLVLVADRGLLTTKNIKVLSSTEGVDWISALRSDSIKTLIEQTHIQPGLFDEVNLFEFSCAEEYPGERLIACRNPALQFRRITERESLLVKTEQELQSIVDRVNAGRLKVAGKIGLAVGRKINRYKMSKHFILEIDTGHFAFRRDEQSIRKEGALDGVYVIRTSLPGEECDAPSCVRSYKNLSEIEKAFEVMKGMTLKVRPIYHYVENRVRAHFFLCLLSYYVEWHMRQVWGELTFYDTDKGFRTDPVPPAERSDSAKKKDSKKRNEDGLRVRKFSEVLSTLAILQKATYRVGSGETTREFEIPEEMTPLQKRALELIETIAVPNK